MIKPINLEALSKWTRAIPADVKRDIQSVAPMLEKLGYDPYAYPPSYGDADQLVAQNTLHVRNNEEYWRRKGLEVQHMSKPPKNYAFYRKPGEAATQQWDINRKAANSSSGVSTSAKTHRDTGNVGNHGNGDKPQGVR